MRKPNLLVVAVDGLRASALGAYGNTIFSTPALDQFASDSFLFDNCFASQSSIDGVYRALWNSVQENDSATDGSSLPRMLHELSYATTLITDDPRVAAQPAAEQFHQTVPLPPHQDEPLRSAEISQTAMARLFETLCQHIETPSSAPQCVWVHSQGMYGPWDAPLQLQDSLRDEGDPPALHDAVVPDVRLRSADDPDIVFQYSVAYAAQVMVLDSCWNAVMDCLKSVQAQHPWVIMLLGTRGFPLGEHGQIGAVDPRMYSEQLHVPWIIQFGSDQARLIRSHQLTSHIDVWPTITELTQSARLQFRGRSVVPLATDPQAPWRTSVLSSDDEGCASLRTLQWSLRRNGESNTCDAELFVRPDDRWELNDVAKLCPDDVQRLTGRMEQLSQSND